MYVGGSPLSNLSETTAGSYLSAKSMFDVDATNHDLESTLLLIKNLESALETARLHLQTLTVPPPSPKITLPLLPSIVARLTSYEDNFLPPDLLNRFMNEMKACRHLFKKVYSNQPSVLLLGHLAYEWHDGKPIGPPLPFSAVPSSKEILSFTNIKFKSSCNSILLNFYGTCKTILRFHKDNEIMLARTNNQVNSIFTISVRTTRRILFSLKRDGAHISFPLLHNSCLTMLRGCQEALFHSIAPGDLPNEQGQRYSITVREISDPSILALSDPAIPVTRPLALTTPATHNKPQPPSLSPSSCSKPCLSQTAPDKSPQGPPPKNILIVGSSLTREIRPDVHWDAKGKKKPGISRHGSSCIVKCLPGAHVSNITSYLSKLKPDYTDSLTDLVVIAGSNNIQNQRDPTQTTKEWDHLTELLKTWKHVKIHLFSPIPRRLTDKHLIESNLWDDYKRTKAGDRSCMLDRFYFVHDFLKNMCTLNKICYIDCLSFFLKKGTTRLDHDLFRPETRHPFVHHSYKGTSILSKLILGKIYDPW